ncbi:MAG: hypothetical protein LLF83_06205 [Methanobacterium sp.]|nr:hypothetical protein [Methanobacterium sp.]
MWNSLSEYIIRNYGHAHKIVEVGVGRFPLVAYDLKEHLKFNIIMTDIKPSHEMIIKDDICHPDLKIYKDAELIYSIRPPEELQNCLEKVSNTIGSDLMIKPLSTDSLHIMGKMKLINYKKAVFYKSTLK